MNSNLSNVEIGKSVHKLKKNKIIDEKFLPYILLSPTLILIFIIMLFPILRVFNLSFQDYSFTRVKQMGNFIGLENFKEIFTNDNIFIETLPTTLRWVLSEVIPQLIFGLIIALILNQVFKGRGFVRAIVFVPWAVSGVLTTMLWSLMFNQHVGLINDVFIRLGIMQESIAWLSNQNTVFNSVVIAELWRGIPFFAITFLAALQGIPNELFESSDIDGCSRTKRLRYIILPYLKQTIIFTTLLRAIWEFNSIDMIFTMTNGGPFRLTTTLPIYMMQTTIIEGDYGYGSALAVIVFFILAIFAAVYLKVSKYGRALDE